MSNSFCIDSMSPIAAKEISNCLFDILKKPLNENRPIIFLCIGTDRSTGDSLGPLLGYKLKKFHKKNIYIYGTLEVPVHSQNLLSILDKIDNCFINPYIVAIDSSLGSIQNIGKVFIEEKPLTPGLALDKQLPEVGNLSIKGIVNIAGNLEFIVLQNTRLFTVMTMVDCIYDGIQISLTKLFKKSSSVETLKLIDDKK